jgi:hypothetical protein
MSPSVSTRSSVSVDKLDRKHNFWANNIDFWVLFDLLYRGGKDIQANAAKILQKRPKEMPEVYSARLAKFDYSNIIGTALGWYQSALFRKDPTVDMKPPGSDKTRPVIIPPPAPPAPAGPPVNGQAAPPPPALPVATQPIPVLSDSVTAPYTAFLQNCDRAKTTYVDLWRDVFAKLLVFKGCYVLVDLPRSSGETNLAQQKASGALEPYVVTYDPRSIINWDVDEAGELNWILVKVETYNQEFLGKGELIDRWTYYDRKNFRIYERARTSDPASAVPIVLDPTGTLISSAASAVAYLVDEGPHSMAGKNRVPIRYFTLPDALWLANRAYLPAMGHCNLENSYHWALFMANLPIPVIKTDSELTQTISETAVIHLDEKGSFEWTEPKGTSFDHSEKALSGKREEIYRALWLMAQGRSSSAAASSSSGYAKELDMQPSKDILAAFGDMIRAGMQNLLGDVALVRDDPKVEFDVRGFNFEIDPALQEAETLEILMSLDIPSDTLYRQAQHRVIDAYLSDANRAIIQTAHNEVDSAPTRSQQQAQEQQQQKLAMDRSLNRAVTGLTTQARNTG